MDLKQVLYGIERELATGDGVAYRRHLIDDAIVIVPGQRLDKQQTIAAIDASPAGTRSSSTTRRCSTSETEARNSPTGSADVGARTFATRR